MPAKKRHRLYVRGYAKLVRCLAKERGDGGRGKATPPDRTSKNLLATDLEYTNYKFAIDVQDVGRNDTP